MIDNDWLSQLKQEVNDGYVRVAQHPSLPLKIYNYTNRCQYEGKWNQVTRKTRGLILDDKNNIIVNPPEKFFNQDEIFAPKINLSKAIILEKADGYMIIIKKDARYGLIVSSRGSFDNKYIEAARQFIDPVKDKLAEGLSYFCELCQDFPGDEAIILTKHPNPKLICWAIRTQDGKEISLSISPFPTVKQLNTRQLKNYLEQEVEGVVAINPRTYERVKIKTEYYLTMHRLISDCSKKKVWQLLCQDEHLDTYDFPDEYISLIKNWEEEIQTEVNEKFNQIVKAYEETKNLTDKELGLLNNYQDIKTYIFMLRKGKDIRNKILKDLKPVL